MRQLSRTDLVLEWVTLIGGIVLVPLMAWAVLVEHYSWLAGAFIAFVGVAHTYSAYLTLTGR
jgi:hypothetical protein